MSFNAFDIGKQVGFAEGNPIDVSRGTQAAVSGFNALRQQSQEQHLNMLESIAKTLGTFNPNGIMEKDIPDFYDKYNDFKNFAVNHIDELSNPAKNPKTYMQYQSKLGDLTGTISQMKNMTKEYGTLANGIVQLNTHDKILGADAEQKFQHFKDTPTLKLLSEGNGTLDMTDLLAGAQNDDASSLKLKNAALDRIKPFTQDVPILNDKGQPTGENIKIRRKNYAHVVGTVRDWYDNVANENQKQYYASLGMSLVKKDKDGQPVTQDGRIVLNDEAEKAIRQLKRRYSPIGEDDVVDGFQFDRSGDLDGLGRSVAEYQSLLESAPTAVGNAINPVWKAQQDLYFKRLNADRQAKGDALLNEGRALRNQILRKNLNKQTGSGKSKDKENTTGILGTFKDLFNQDPVLLNAGHSTVPLYGDGSGAPVMVSPQLIGQFNKMFSTNFNPGSVVNVTGLLPLNSGPNDDNGTPKLQAWVKKGSPGKIYVYDEALGKSLVLTPSNLGQFINQIAPYNDKTKNPNHPIDPATMIKKWSEINKPSEVGGNNWLDQFKISNP